MTFAPAVYASELPSGDQTMSWMPSSSLAIDVSLLSTNERTTSSLCRELSSFAVRFERTNATRTPSGDGTISDAPLGVLQTAFGALPDTATCHKLPPRTK